MEISSTQFHLGKFGHTQKGANGSLVWTALNNEVQSPQLSVHVSLFCTLIWPRWRHVKTIYYPLSFLLRFRKLLPAVGVLFTVVLATVDVKFVVFAFIVVSASVATDVTVLGGTYSLPAKESHFFIFLNNLIYALSNGLKIILSSLNIFFLEWNAIGINRDNNLLYKHQWNTRWAFARKHDIFTRENNMLFSHVKISLFLWLHDNSRLSQDKTVSVKWFGISLVVI